VTPLFGNLPSEKIDDSINLWLDFRINVDLHATAPAAAVH